ncbi:unnamed protein product [Parnassius apollo]|uniref:(apollo) hypothetical protein n=1 Tax=Parnassius apollo TaxID=110799 RepID=A0A8S3X7Z8_PARAO|nr:unnamed protein product [Parnassius apollo]
MTANEEKSRLLKILQDLEVPEDRLPERCQGLLKEFYQKFAQELEENVEDVGDVYYENPYIPDKESLKENERKLRELLSEEKRTKQECIEENTADVKRPWRINSSKEKLLRIDGDLKRHLERGADLIEPLTDTDMQELVKTCLETNAKSGPINADLLRETIDDARMNLPNFQYRKVDNKTATAILLGAHVAKDNVTGKDDGKNRLN